MAVNARCLAGLLLLAGCAGCWPTVAERDAQELAEVRMREARAAFERGNVRGAADAYQRILDSDPSVARAHLDLALLQQDHLRDPVEAVHHYRVYLRLRPETEKRPLIENRMQRALEALGAGAAGPDGRLRELETNNAALQRRVAELEAEVQRLRGERETRPPAVRTYRVQAGDTLAKIARDVYGDENRWRDLYEANRTRLPNSNVVPVGTLLVIP